MDTAERKLNSLQKVIEKLEHALDKAQENILSKQQIVDILINDGFSESDYYQVVQLLSQSEIATGPGKGRTRGIAEYNKDAEREAIQEAEEELTDANNSPIEDSPKIRSERSHESVLYPLAAKLITDEGYQSLILGVKRRLSGEWNTPDLVGYRVAGFSVLCGAEVEVVTVEVKWSISKSAIAEAKSHQKSGHRSYLMVHQDRSEIDSEYISELIESGLGLICQRSTPTIVIPAQRNWVEKADLDEFLTAALTHEGVQEIQNELAKRYYRDIFIRILPSTN